MNGAAPAEDALTTLLIRQEIHDVIVRYCRAADRCDAAGMKACFHPDAWDDHGFFDGPATQFADQAAAGLRERFVSTKHFMTNELVEIDGAEARCETYILAVMRMTRERERFDVTLSCRYLDRFERRAGCWLIAHRKLVVDGTRIDPVAEEDLRLAQGTTGGRGDADPAADFFRKSGAAGWTTL